jgi:hypothetical protein
MVTTAAISGTNAVDPTTKLHTGGGMQLGKQQAACNDEAEAHQRRRDGNSESRRQKKDAFWNVAEGAKSQERSSQERTHRGLKCGSIASETTVPARPPNVRTNMQELCISVAALSCGNCLPTSRVGAASST